ncbi:acetoacetate decarboxylase family protein [Streptomyces sp. NPDC127110]|uniref:acetoacetate decarboxylase family protein n=1 Tax=Streptomyces sp. NPDC127110 TaxID=3345362 RepID=UPI003639498A
MNRSVDGGPSPRDFGRASHLIQGQQVSMPVEVREASGCSALFLVPADRAQSVIDYSGLKVLRPFPGKAVCSLLFIRYTDNDLGCYDEFGVNFLVRPPDRGRVGMFVHWLPVTGSFTMEAGRSIWGYPKELADIRLNGHECVVSMDGRPVIGMRVRPGVPVPGGAMNSAVPAFSCMDGVTRRIEWSMHPEGVRSRYGGVRIQLGDHPIADQLRSLGLPKRAVMSSTIRQMQATIFDAETVTV